MMERVSPLHECSCSHSSMNSCPLNFQLLARMAVCKPLVLFVTPSLYAQACIRCGTTSTPLWRPEVLSGPKVLCNACGVKVLYPLKARRPKPDTLQSPDASQRSHQHGSAKKSASHENGLNGFHTAKRPRSFAEEGSSRQQTNKRQRTAPIEGDIKLSPTQTPYFAVQRHFDAEGHVVEWTVTDCTINDSRDFQQLKHAQAFVDECWAFISVDLR